MTKAKRARVGTKAGSDPIELITRRVEECGPADINASGWRRPPIQPQARPRPAFTRRLSGMARQRP